MLGATMGQLPVGLVVDAQGWRAALWWLAATGGVLGLLLRVGDDFRTVRIDYRGGLRYPKLVRIDGVPDRLTPLLSPR